MLPYSNLLTLDRAASIAVYQQIANQLVSLIRDGLLKAGMKLPSSRELANLLQVHRKTVTAAYDELAVQGWIVSHPKKGMFISTVLPELDPKRWSRQPLSQEQDNRVPFFYTMAHAKNFEPPISLGYYDWVIDDGLPDARLAPLDTLLRDYKSRIQKKNIYKGSANTPSAGSLLLREALVNYLADTRGMAVNTDQLLITQGAQMGIYIAARLLLRPGDMVVVGEPGYFMANQVFEQLGAKIIRVVVDSEGLVVDQVAEICKKQKINMLYVIPHHHHPTTVTLSPQRRMQLTQLAEQYRFFLVEDDYDYDFHYQSSPYLPLASSCNNHVIYIGSLTKCLAPFLRVGFMSGPKIIIDEAIKLRRQINLRGDFMMEDALATLITTGDLGRHIKKSVSIYNRRRDCVDHLMRRELTDIVDFSLPSGGMAIWLRFHPAYSLKQLAQQVAKDGLLMSDGSKYNTDQQDYNALRFGFASLDINELETVVQIIQSAAKKLASG